MRSRQFIELLGSLLILFCLAGPATASSLAKQVVIHRDHWDDVVGNTQRAYSPGD